MLLYKFIYNICIYIYVKYIYTYTVCKATCIYVFTAYIALL